MDLCHSNKSLLNAQFLKIIILYILNLVSCRFIHNKQEKGLSYIHSKIVQ